MKTPRTTARFLILALILLTPLPTLAGGYEVNHNWTLRIGPHPYGLIERTDQTTTPKITHTTVYAGSRALRIHAPASVVAGSAALLAIAAFAALCSLRNFFKKSPKSN